MKCHLLQEAFLTGISYNFWGPYPGYIYTPSLPLVCGDLGSLASVCFVQSPAGRPEGWVLVFVSASVPCMTLGLGRAENMSKETSKPSLVHTAASPGPVQNRVAGSDRVSRKELTLPFVLSHWLAVVCLWWPSDKFLVSSSMSY